MVTRDSWVLVIAGLASVLTYLQASPPPTQWDYAEWVKAIAMLVGIISAQLGWSPLPGKRD